MTLKETIIKALENKIEINEEEVYFMVGSHKYFVDTEDNELYLKHLAPSKERNRKWYHANELCITGEYPEWDEDDLQDFNSFPWPDGEAKKVFDY